MDIRYITQLHVLMFYINKGNTKTISLCILLGSMWWIHIQWSFWCRGKSLVSHRCGPGVLHFVSSQTLTNEYDKSKVWYSIIYGRILNVDEKLTQQEKTTITK